MIRVGHASGVAWLGSWWVGGWIDGGLSLLPCLVPDFSSGLGLISRDK